jgi:hypothetical protein
MLSGLVNKNLEMLLLCHKQCARRCLCDATAPGGSQPEVQNQSSTRMTSGITSSMSKHFHGPLIMQVLEKKKSAAPSESFKGFSQWVINTVR